jgi:hypothetical protein
MSRDPGLSRPTIRVIPDGTAGCRVVRLNVIVRIPRAVEPILQRKFEWVAVGCPAHRTLADDVAVEVRFEAGDGGRS